MSERATEFKTVGQDATHIEPLKVVLVDRSKDARDMARDTAEARLDQELNEGGRVKKFLNGIWKGNIAKEYYRQKYTREAEADIKETNDLFLGATTPERRIQAIEATIERFQSDDAELYHSAVGERREVRSSEDELSQAIKGLIREYVSHRDTAKLEERKKEVLNEYRENYGDELLGKGIATADNLVAIAEAVMGRAEHEESLDRTIDSIQVVVGEARDSVRTEAHYTAVDKVIDKLGKTRIGSLVTPATLATAVAATAAITRFGTQSVASSAAATIAPGVLAGVWGGIRENKRVKDERAQHAREMAVGGHFEESDKRRAEMETSRYAAKSAVDLIGELRRVGAEDTLNEGGNEALKVALDALARAEARVTLSDQKSIDLISYSDKVSVGEERMMLDLARRDVRLALESRMDETARAELDIPIGPDIRGIIAQRANTYISDELEKDMTAKDKAFAKLKARRVRNAAIASTVVGVAGGLLAQEVASAIDPSRYGIADIVNGSAPTIDSNGEIHQSILAGAFRGDESTVHTNASVAFDTYNPSQAPESSISLSNDHTLVENPDGTFNLVDGDGTATVEDITINSDGIIDASEIDRIEAAGMTVDVSDNSWTETITETKTEQVSLNDYIERHADQAEKVSIDKWFNNNTPQSDQNELRVYRGGKGGMIDGGYRLEAGGMHADGSWVGGESVNPLEEAKQGNLVLVVSRMGEDAGPMFVVQGDANGNFDIMNDDPASAFFTNVNGRMELAEGFRASVFVKQDVDANGVIRGGSLATMVGEANVDTVSDTVETTREVVHHEYEYRITTNGYDTSIQNITEVAPITPVTSRRSMEAIKAYRESDSSGEIGSSYYYGEQNWQELEQKWRKGRSPRLRKNPDADLNTGEELDWYREEQTRRRGQEYIQEIDSYIEASDVLKGIDTNTAAIVCIPVAAVNESENIYRTLSMYARQDSKEAIDQTVVLLNINWRESLAKDPSNLEKINKTLSEIERAKKDFPDLKVASFNKVWSESFVSEKKNKIYGEVIKVLYDTAALAFDRAVKSGARSKDSEAILITNDADTEGMSRSYLRRYIDTFKNNPKQDAFTGVIRRGTESYKEYPGYGVVSAFYAMMTQSMLRHQAIKGSGSTTDGPNSGVRMSMYAAMGGVDESYGAGADAQLSSRMIISRRVKGERTLADRLRGISAPQGSDRVIGKLVSGATVDTVPDRLLGAYREGKWIARGWDNFDSNGYEDRSASLSKAVVQPENVEQDIDAIAERIERSLNGFGSYWWKDHPGAMKTAMIWTFGPNREDIPKEKRTSADQTRYEYRWDLSKDGDGRFTFKFTEEGKKWLKNRLLRDTRGRFDSYGSRIRRQLYGEVVEGSSREIAQSIPRMLA